MEKSNKMQSNLGSSVFILNISYTGLGIARSLAEAGIKIYGIGSKRCVFGNFSRYIEFYLSPDSLTEPKNLCNFLITLAKEDAVKPIIFPTRDHDVIFINNYREKLEPYFIISQPNSDVLDVVLNKWELFQTANECRVLSPDTYLVNSPDELQELSSAVEYPVLIKPIYAADWRKNQIWEAVGKRKTILVQSEQELWAEYNDFYRLQPMMLLQEYIKGNDDEIFTFCSYCNRNSDILSSFNTHKIIQMPEKFGTGIVVQSVINDDITEFSEQLLKHIGYTGISEIEYKRNPITGKYYLIEINPRFWDQHQLSKSRGINLPLLAYNDLANKATPTISYKFCETTWIAEDSFIQYILSKLFVDKKISTDLFRKLHGNRQYAVWNIRDPLPFIVFMASMTIKILKQIVQKLF